ncbi:MAG: hypothetical protein EOP50_17830 [Sphingobacteriales bacterium]|nr:MAG: hypothetical protein EOP50_17830 [Sphingobacteriales bacterium]
MHPELSTIRNEVSPEFSDESLDQLELLVTRYRDFLEQAATPEADCAYYTGRLRPIEMDLESARYGNNEQQRARGYHNAAMRLVADMDEFAEKFRPRDGAAE